MSRSFAAPLNADVGIAGSGLVAHAAALALAQAGLKVALVGPPPHAAAIEADGYDNRVFALNAQSRALLMQLRVWPAIDAARIQPVEQMALFAGRATLGFDAYEAAQQALAWIVESSRLQQALQAAAAFHPGIERVSAPLRAVARSDEGMRLEWEGGALHCALLVVAEAACAPLVAERFAWDEHDYAASALVGTLRCGRPHRATAYQWFGRRDTADGPVPSVLALLPLAGSGGNFVSLVWSTAESAALHALDRGALGAALTEASARALGELEVAGPTALWPLRRRLARQVWSDAVVLIGDVAHTVHPLAGQGLNLGLQDVAALAEVLGGREPFRALHDARLLRRYARRRAEQTAAIAALTHGLWRLHEGEEPRVLALFQAAAMKWLDRAGPLKREMVMHAQATAFLR